MKKFFALFFIMAVFLSTFSGCAVPQNAEKPVIAVSIIPESTFVKAVVGEKFDVVTLIPSGASPETYEPTPKEITALYNAKVYFSIGVPSEVGILKNVQKDTLLVPLHEKTAEKYPDLTLDGGRDPHIWLCPERAKFMVSIIADTISEADPENAEFYRQNAQNYINEIEKEILAAKTILENAETRDFMVFHPSFQYYANYFGLNMYALEQHGKEATAKDLAQMVDFAKARKIKAVFYQAEATSKQAKTFADEIGGKAVMLEPLSANYAENLSKMAKEIAGE